MEHLPLDVISHIGKFLTFEDRKSCLLANKCFKPINYNYNQHIWSIVTTFENKLDALLKLKPSVNSLMINIDNFSYLSEDNLAKDLINITSKITNVELKINANNPYLRFILQSKFFIFKHIEIYVRDSVDLATLYDILKSGEYIMIHELNIYSFSSDTLPKILTMNHRIKERLNIYDDSVANLFGDVDVKALQNIPVFELWCSGCCQPDIFLSATILSFNWTLDNNMRTFDLLDTLKTSTRLQEMWIEHINIIFFMKSTAAFEKLKQVIVCTKCNLTLCGPLTQDVNILSFIEMLLDWKNDIHIELRDTDNIKMGQIVKYHFKNNSNIIYQNYYNLPSLEYSDLIKNIPNIYVRKSWEKLQK